MLAVEDDGGDDKGRDSAGRGTTPVKKGDHSSGFEAVLSPVLQ
jgi:hypothetical protein